MKNAIEQIRKIKGVVTVEKAGEGMAVVVFEPKPKSLTPEELVDGRIYVDQYSKDWCNIFRYAGEFRANQVSMYSLFCTHNDRSSLNGYLISDFIRPATPSEAQSLIRAEIANNFFFELR